MTATIPFSLSGFWQPDAARRDCQDCHAPFSFFRRRHHCRGCGYLFCGACAPVRPSISMRLCTRCEGRADALAPASKTPLPAPVAASEASSEDAPTSPVLTLVSARSQRPTQAAAASSPARRRASWDAASVASAGSTASAPREAPSTPVRIPPRREPLDPERVRNLQKLMRLGGDLLGGEEIRLGETRLSTAAAGDDPSLRADALGIEFLPLIISDDHAFNFDDEDRPRGAVRRRRSSAESAGPRADLTADEHERRREEDDEDEADEDEEAKRAESGAARGPRRHVFGPHLSTSQTAAAASSLERAGLAPALAAAVPAVLVRGRPARSQSSGHEAGSESLSNTRSMRSRTGSVEDPNGTAAAASSSGAARDAPAAAAAARGREMHIAVPTDVVLRAHRPPSTGAGDAGEAEEVVEEDGRGRKISAASRRAPASPASVRGQPHRVRSGRSPTGALSGSRSVERLADLLVATGSSSGRRVDVCTNCARSFRASAPSTPVATAAATQALPRDAALALMLDGDFVPPSSASTNSAHSAGHLTIRTASTASTNGGGGFGVLGAGFFSPLGSPVASTDAFCSLDCETSFLARTGRISHVGGRRGGR